MQLFRDFGYISQAQYDDVDGKCKDQGAELSDECQAAIDQVEIILFRLIN